MSTPITHQADSTLTLQSQYLDRYLAELARWVPAKNRAGAEADVRAQVAALLAMRGVSDEKAVLAALKELGAPQRFALNYGGAHSLIGPVLYPTFVTVLQIVLSIVLAVNLFGVFAAIGWQQETVSVGGALADILASLTQATGMVVIIFALVERFARIEAKDLDKNWNPKSLPAAKDQDRIKVGETIFGIAFTIVFIVFLSFFLNRSGGYYVPGQGWSPVLFFTDHFYSFLPWMIGLLAADALLSIVVLARGFWQPATRLVKIALGLASLALLFSLLTGPALLLFPAFEVFARISVAIVMVVTLFDVGAQIWRIVRRPDSGASRTTLAGN